jgi:plastocyanin
LLELQVVRPLPEENSGKHRWTDPVILVPIIGAVIAAIVGPIVVPIVQNYLSQSPETSTPATVNPQTPQQSTSDPLSDLGSRLASNNGSTSTPTETTTTTPPETAGIGAESTVVMPLGSSAAGPGYEPATITVSPGATVVWDNQDNALHTATSGESPAPDGRFDTGLIGKNKESLPVTMPSEPGDY